MRKWPNNNPENYTVVNYVTISGIGNILFY
jgi:hypothetical protein